MDGWVKGGVDRKLPKPLRIQLFEVVKNRLLNIHAYTDDTQIYLSFKPDSTAGEQDAIPALQDCITDIRSWMIADRLKLNDDKTEF